VLYNSSRLELNPLMPPTQPIMQKELFRLERITSISGTNLD